MLAPCDRKQRERNSGEVRQPGNTLGKGLPATFKSQVPWILKPQIHSFIWHLQFRLLLCAGDTRSDCLFFCHEDCLFHCEYGDVLKCQILPPLTSMYPGATAWILVRARSEHLCRDQQLLSPSPTELLLLRSSELGLQYKNINYLWLHCPGTSEM